MISMGYRKHPTVDPAVSPYLCNTKDRSLHILFGVLLVVSTGVFIKTNIGLRWIISNPLLNKVFSICD